MTLFGYWRSSAAYRVRIALNLKGLQYEQKSVHLIKDGGQQHAEDYADLNPNKLVPTLVDGEFTLNQSLAILEYLEIKYPNINLLPANLADNMKCRALALDLACDIHPLNNLRVLQYLTGPLAQSEEQKMQWYFNWLEVGFTAFEKSINKVAGNFCFGDHVSWADLCLIPQVYNAERFNFDMSPYPLIQRVVAHCRTLDAFTKAAPENQPDAV
ncbi:maleylacetoacetate isomerase [Psychrosphaera sp. 1_MG-2023]|uniref:Maleylacetoacetate isomerase n=1 Tax=Psychrosphaera algicola TaxID=3023714 RepID=A0ABT5FJJ4_9GAMM|nr:MULTISPECIES: maleylacetoacetate isomerase [unclassified Psychrosphaera]MDC2891368.1 maleylacetoacetate isomerase [Psychrosphaera sp. G1-22]MDO6720019.1 maleylacetoacetate isomerase [Psychrosphaera sp. 1_MG-2023]